LAGYDEVVERFGDAVEPGVRVHVAVATVHKRIVLGELGVSPEEVGSPVEASDRGFVAEG
jgi:hypothetical protein